MPQEQATRSTLVTNLHMLKSIIRNQHPASETTVNEKEMTLTVKNIPSAVLSKMKLPTCHTRDSIPSSHFLSFSVHLDREHPIHFPGLRELAQHYSDMQEGLAIMANEPNFYPFGNTIPTKKHNSDGDSSEYMRGMDLIIDQVTSLMPGLDNTSGKPKKYSFVIGYNKWLVNTLTK